LEKVFVRLTGKLEVCFRKLLFSLVKHASLVWRRAHS